MNTTNILFADTPLSGGGSSILPKGYMSVPNTQTEAQNDESTTILPLIDQFRKKWNTILRVAREGFTDETYVTRSEIDELQQRIATSDDDMTINQRDATVLWAALADIRFDYADRNVIDKRFNQLENLMCEMDQELGNYNPGFGKPDRLKDD